MARFFGFFFGTWRRTGYTLLGGFILLAMADKTLAYQMLGQLIGRLWDAVGPLVVYLAMLGIALWGVGIIIRAPFRKRK